MIRLKLLHSLVKVFPEQEPVGELPDGISLFRNERLHFQLAVYLDRPNLGAQPLQLAAEGALAPFVMAERVGLVPCGFPAYDGADSYLFTAPRLAPDVLYPLEDGCTEIVPGRYESLWLTVDGTRGPLPDGEHTLRLTVTAGEDTAAAEIAVCVLPAALPPQQLLFTQWLHGDGIAWQHRAPMFSERFWTILEDYVRTAARHGITLLYTPLFTPPLDTAIGGERETCQLVDVTLTANGGYRFGFDRLTRWIDMAHRCGIRHFELSHLFTQWGANAAPKVVAHDAATGEMRRIFGWDTPACGGEYERFLDAFLPQLDAFLRDAGVSDQCFLHVSDEPGEAHLAAYSAAAAIVRRGMPGYPIMDAMSEYAIYAKSEVSDPVVAIDHIEPFVAQDTAPLWGYYCCGQNREVPNRFIAMPPARDRITGTLCWQYGLRGFLQWGYNFYNLHHSTAPIDPYACTDAGCAFPSGDPFSVYPDRRPGHDGCLRSLRLAVFADGLQDHRALCLLSSLIGREETQVLLTRLTGGMTMRRYPREAQAVLSLRHAVNEQIMLHLGR